MPKYRFTANSITHSYQLFEDRGYMNRREALIDIVALTGAICAGYYGGGIIQSGKADEIPGPEEYKVRSGVLIRGEEKFITDGDRLLKA